MSANRVTRRLVALGGIAAAATLLVPGNGRAQASSLSAEPTNTEEAMSIRLTVGDAVATATLRTNETARNFASLLPLTLSMNDLFGREKYGNLPRAIAEPGGHQFTYGVGDVAYWPPTHDLAIFYAADGARIIPNPGIILIGTIDSGLDALASAGGDFQMTIERID